MHILHPLPIMNLKGILQVITALAAITTVCALPGPVLDRPAGTGTAAKLTRAECASNKGIGICI
ncbi:hypothetical protein CC2G_003852 [Coprinopsis cinerea AmutBmut pab1-1]|nr:hypothetical protein CC2G_003852 [Coprinopsis cinerea AmutBmut pab1-1]KAG2003232.1 hypothetical protein CC2G_003852 [Coprinopsis cinerea AmutBmut pab1-1]